jgi:2-iminobutanoate/2-iminopropanoate deaminase
MVRVSRPRGRVWPMLLLTGAIVANTGHAQERAVIASDGAPKAIGPYSQAISAGHLVFLSGQIGLDPTGKTELSSLDVEAQTHRAMDNLAAVLRAAGLSMKDVVATTLYVADLKDFDAINRAYGSYFASSAPARSTVQVAALPRGAKIEIAAIASRP